uniref:LEM domain-containing protein n=1 Tax=Xiphophorus maculatus TaxID=8083 RepID=A0A3B5QEB5_XIPMA
MIPLSKKSDAQISDLLTDYGIKHGPVVNSTRGLYERKLKEAMASDRTFYREEGSVFHSDETVKFICYLGQPDHQADTSDVRRSENIDGGTEEAVLDGR